MTLTSSPFFVSPTLESSTSQVQVEVTLSSSGGNYGDIAPYTLRDGRILTRKGDFTFSLIGDAADSWTGEITACVSPGDAFALLAIISSANAKTSFVASSVSYNGAFCSNYSTLIAY